MKPKIIKLNENLVRRNYNGGRTLKEIRGIKNPKDDNRPEEWIASLVLAKNPGQEIIENEGLSIVNINDKEIYLTDLILENPNYYLGEEYYKKNGLDFGFLTKIIDSSMRLHTQAHPTKEFAKEFLNSPYGKFECYYVLSSREDTQPYIRLGFQKEIDKEKWKEIVENQNIEKMDSLFEKIPVKAGDLIYIPGGVPHAIGEGLFLIEVMEPSDLVVRCEYEREGIIVPENARFMGKSIEFCMDIFDYTKYSVEDVKNNFFVKPKSVTKKENYEIEKLLSSDIAPSFEITRITAKDNVKLELDDRFALFVVAKGSANIKADDESVKVGYCDSLFIPANTKEINIELLEECVICCIQSL